MTTSTQPRAAKPARDDKWLTRRIIGRVIDNPNPAAIPPNKWLVDNLKDFYKNIPSFRRDVRAAAAVAGAVSLVLLTTVVGGAVLAVTGALTLTIAGIAAGTAALTGLAAWRRGAHIWQRAQSETIPRLKEEFGKRYIKDGYGVVLATQAVTNKAKELFGVWKSRRDAAKTAKKAAAPPPAGLGKAFDGSAANNAPEKAPAVRQGKVPRGPR